MRFSRDEIYTFVGSLLLAVNPYKPIPHLYGEQAMGAFEGSTLVDAPPHVYALVEGAYRKAIRGGGSQSLIISGESGAGKTESTKLALSYLVWRTRLLREPRSPGGSPLVAAASPLTTSVIQANPLMEAFGNACTSRNSNSSRFGKCVRLGLDSSTGELLGGQVYTYLLEKSRVVSFEKGVTSSLAERNFHAFYQLLAGIRAHAEHHSPLGFLSYFRNRSAAASPAGAPAADIPGAATAKPPAPAEPSAVADFVAGFFPSDFFTELGLTGVPADYQLLGVSEWGTQAEATSTSRVVDDLGAFRVTCIALTDLGCSTDDVSSLFSLLAALLHLGNAAFDDDAKGNAKASPGAGVDAIAAAGRALKCGELESLLTHRSLNVRGEVTRIDLRAEQAERLLRGLLKSLYTLGFAWIVRRVNTVLQVGGGWPESAVVIDILDIFGFENFTHNSFEQVSAPPSYHPVAR